MKGITKKFISMIMVMVMVLAMTMVPAFATESNITQVSKAQYTTFLDVADKTVTLYATTTTDEFDVNVPFGTSAEANAVDWGWTVNGYSIDTPINSSDGLATIVETGNISSGSLPITPTYSPTGSGYYAYAKVKLNEVIPPAAVYSVIAVMGESTCNFTVAVEDLTDLSSVTVDVKILDGITSTVPLVDEEDVEVDPSIFDPFNVLFLKPDTYQFNPSAMGVLDALRGITTTPEDFDTFTTSDNAGQYVNSMEIDSILYEEEEYDAETNPNPKGWMYGVYRDNGTQYELVGISSVVSASAFPIEDGDKILWVYTPYIALPSVWQ